MVDAHLRLKTINTEDIKNLIIGGQTGIDGIRFVLASSVNGEDLTNASFTWYLQYKNKYGQGESVVLDATVEDNLVKLTWVPDSLASQVPGRLQIQLYATIVEGVGQAAVVTTRWVSEPALIYVQENLSPDPIIQTELSVFDYYLTMYSSFKEAAESAAAAALASAQAAESSKNNASQSEINAAQSATASEDAAIVSQEAEALINAKLLGAFAADPATGSAGAVYYNTVQKVLKVYDADSSTWKVAYADASQVGYDHASSGLASDNVQDAIDENANELTTKTSKSQIAYGNDSATFIANTLASGAIIERGSNANGSYTKYADGTMICTYLLDNIYIDNATPATFDSVSGGYRHTYGRWTFPATFTGLAVVLGNCVLARGTTSYVYGFVSSNIGGGNTQSEILVLFTTTEGVDGIVRLALTAIGRWK